MEALNSTLYTVLFLLIMGYTNVNIIFDYLITQVFRENLRGGLPVSIIIISLVSLIIVSYAAYRKFVENGYYLQLQYALLLFSTSTLFWYHRFSGSYEFFPVHDGLPEFKILDLPLLIYTCFTIVILFNSIFKRKVYTNYLEILVADRPLESEDEDEFRRENFYQSTLDSIKICAPACEGSVSIGIANSWGEGKSSFLRFLTKKLKTDKNTLVLHYNPWFSTNKENMTLDFFKTLDVEISKVMYTGSVMRKYAQNLTNINSVFNPLKYLPDKWISEKSNQQYFTDISVFMRELKTRVFVIIDDLDRLDNKEVFSIFQIIRNSANFPNVIFITPFDKDYVVKSLNALKIPKPADYIKKMFDVELTLPPISKYHLISVYRDYFAARFKTLEKVTEEDSYKLHEQINQALTDTGLMQFSVAKYTVINRYIFQYLKNKRDLIRYVNSVTLLIRYHHSIVYLPDLLILELIKYIDFDIYRKLFQNTNYLNTISEENSFITRYKLFRKDEPDTDEMNIAHRIMNSSISDFDIRLDDVGKRIGVSELIEELFAEPLKNDFRSSLSMYYSRNYSNYHQLNQEGISQEEIDQLFS